jgi:hypothetical protein
VGLRALLDELDTRTVTWKMLVQVALEVAVADRSEARAFGMLTASFPRLSATRYAEDTY